MVKKIVYWRRQITARTLRKIGKTSDPDAKAFFSVLSRNKKVIYDWRYGSLWAIDGDEDDESVRYCMNGEDFIGHTKAFVITSADLLIFLLRSGLSVDVRNKFGETFANQAEWDDFMKGINEEVSVIRPPRVSNKEAGKIFSSLFAARPVANNSEQ